MTVLINLMSRKRGELKKFINAYFNSSQLDDDVLEWIYIYNDPADAINIIENFIENKSHYNISLWVQICDEDLIAVDKHNIGSIIKRLNRV